MQTRNVLVIRFEHVSRDLDFIQVQSFKQISYSIHV